MSDCPFCDRIATREYDFTDARSVAFQPLNPVVPGHFLVVPRMHCSSALGNPIQAGHAMRYAAFMALQMELGAVNFITSAGAAATQSVPHLHIHVVPRREGDGLHLPWTGQGDDLVTVRRSDLGEVLRMACDCPQALPVSPDEDAILGRLSAAVRS